MPWKKNNSSGIKLKLTVVVAKSQSQHEPWVKNIILQHMQKNMPLLLTEMIETLLFYKTEAAIYMHSSLLFELLLRESNKLNLKSALKSWHAHFKLKFIESERLYRLIQ